MRVSKAFVVLAILILPGIARQSLAEPWIAVQQGMKCAACHVNASGGGMRNEYGNVYAQMQLAATQLASTESGRWNGRLNEFVAVGGNLRADTVQVDVPEEESQLLFELNEARLYLQFSPLPGRVDVYLDQRVAPGGSLNREAYARYWSKDHDWYVKAGQMYLPYGLRLEDDSAFIRAVPGINFTTPDTGIEFGWEKARWSAQIAASNGTAGGPEMDSGKQASLRVEHVRANWRAGASANINDTDAGTRSMQNIFAGLRTGPVAWLAEVDVVRDDSTPGELTQRMALLEANWNFRRGHNLKLTTEILDANTDFPDDQQRRYSLFWEYFPFEFTQVRVGTRMYDSDLDTAIQNRSMVVVQLHGYF